MAALEARPGREGSPLALGFFGALATVALVAGLLDLLPGVDPRFAFGAAAWLASRGAWRYAEARGGEAARIATCGAGWSALALLGLAPLEPPYSLAAPGAAVLVLGAFLFAASSKPARGRAIVALLGLGALAAAYPLLEPALADAIDVPRARFIVFYGIVVGAVLATRVVRASPLSRSRLVAEIARSELRNFAFALPFAAYAAYRPVLVDALAHFAVYEWSLGLAAAFYVAATVRARFRDGLAETPWTLAGGRHTRAVVPRYDPRFEDALRAFASFVDHGAGREAYLAFWTRALDAAGVPRAEAAALVARAAEAPGAPSTRERALAFARSGREARAAEAAREKRAEAHRALLARIVRSTDRTELNRDGGTSRQSPLQ